MSVFIENQNDHNIHAVFDISVVDGSGNEKHTRKTSHNFVETEPDWGWSRFILREILFKKENRLISNNTLTLAVKIEVTYKESDCLLSKLKSSESERIHDLYNKRSFTDLEVKVQEKSIRAHKILLVARSSVLAEQIEENQNVLELDDLEFEVAEEMINFIYDGEVKDIEKYAKPLLEAAEEFKIERLKKYCEKYLCENLCVENAIDILKLSTKCHAEELKGECADFIREYVNNRVLRHISNLILF